MGRSTRVGAMSADGSDEVRLWPERFVAGGDAIGHDVDGRVVFVRGAAPGDEVAAVVVEDARGWRRAVVSEVIVASRDRVVPPCPQRRIGCGGCDWQHLAVGAQLAAKVEIVRDAFRRTARLPEARVTVGGAVRPDGYRTTLRVVGDSDGRPSLRAERSHDAIPVLGCIVAHHGLRDLLDDIRISPGLEATLRVSAATGSVGALWDRRAGEVTGLPPGTAIGPRGRIDEEVAGRRLLVSNASFFQSGPTAAELLVDAVARAAPELDHAACVLDAYAGVGLFAVVAVPEHAHVITVESSRSAVADSRVNLAGRSATVERGEFGRWGGPGRRRVDVAIADPARSGLAKPGTAALARARAPVVVLVSCDPVSAARDAALLAGHGYRHDGTQVLDVFPHTHHVECVTRFVRAD